MNLQLVIWKRLLSAAQNVSQKLQIKCRTKPAVVIWSSLTEVSKSAMLDLVGFRLRSKSDAARLKNRVIAEELK